MGVPTELTLHRKTILRITLKSTSRRDPYANLGLLCIAARLVGSPLLPDRLMRALPVGKILVKRMVGSYAAKRAVTQNPFSGSRRTRTIVL